MDIRPAIQLQSAIKSLKDTVIPAVDPANKMAVEQAHPVAATLELIASRLSVQYRYDRDELSRLVAMADKMAAADLPGRAGAELETAAREASGVIERARAEPGELERAILQLRADFGAVIKELPAEHFEVSGSGLGRVVLDAAKEQIERERAWVAAMGFDPDPAAISGLEHGWDE